MRGRFRKRRKEQWLLPISNDSGQGAGNSCTLRQILIPTGTGAAYSYGTSVVPVIFDYDASADHVQGGISLADRSLNVNLQDVFIKRVVGKVVVGATIENLDAPETSAASAIGVCCALFVADATREAGGLGTSDLPQGFATNPQEYNPWDGANQLQPWMWRRTWILSTGGSGAGAVSAPVNTINYYFPKNNIGGQFAGYGAGIYDGPHVDWKGTRRIKKHERLWFITWAYNLPLTVSDNYEQSAVCSVSFEFRVLGHMARGRNSGAVA